MEDYLIELLETFEYPVIRQGSLGPDEKYPDTFFTVWNNDETEHSAYDNQTLNIEYDYDVYVYSTNPARCYSLLAQARDFLKQNGWVSPSRGYDVPSDEITHIGRGIEVTYLKNKI